jgi:hypothetical protein
MPSPIEDIRFALTVLGLAQLQWYGIATPYHAEPFGDAQGRLREASPYQLNYGEAQSD